MNKKMICIAGFYLVTFVVTFFLASYILNYDRTHPSKNQGDTSLIKLSMKISGIPINEMDGYLREMDAAYMRMNVTPLSENKTLTLKVSEPEKKTRHIRYALMDETSTETIETGEFPEIQRVEGQRQTEITFTSELDLGREYCLNLTLEDEAGQTYYYYTRLIYGNDLRAYDKVQFALDFHKATFEKTAVSGISEYLKSSGEGIDDDFRHVTIHSDGETVTWGSLAPEVVGDVRVAITDLDSQTGDIRLFYEIVARDDSGNDYNYTVQENYRVSATGSDVELLGYSRTMEEKLDEQSFFFDGSQLRLGMIDEEGMDIYVYGKEEPEGEAAEASEDKEEYNTYVSFVADGGLWVYNMRDNILTKAFGFERGSQISQRDSSYLNHGVKVLRTETNGDLYFAVYGYMYNGDREGDFGISVNRYNRIDGTYSEVLFIPYDKSFRMLEQGVSKMAFMDSNQMLYICLEDTVYRFDIEMKTCETVIDQVGQSSSVSENGRHMVRSITDDQGKVTALEWTNLETGASQQIQSEDGRLKLIGMMGENLVYGIEKSTEPKGLENLYIVDTNLQVLKEHRVKDGYISKVEIRKDLVEISQKDKSGKDLPAEYILYNENSDIKMDVLNRYQEMRGKESWLDTGVYGSAAPVVFYARAIEAYRNTQMEFDAQSEDYTGYYVYQDEELTKYQEFKDGYREALTAEGKVLDNQGRIISRPVPVSGEADLNGYSIDLAGTDVKAQQKSVLKWLMGYEGISGEPVLAGEDMMANIAAALPAAHVVDMTGISLEDALPMIAEGYPLVVKNSKGTWCVVEGYKNGYIVIADPLDGTVSGYEWDSAVAGIASSGNVIYSYFK